MTWTEALSHADRFQTALVGVIGFGGVILTLLANARLTERNRKRERLDRAKAVAALVQAELEVLLGALLACSDPPESTFESDVLLPKLKISFAHNILDELGLLGPTLCREIMFAHAAVDNLMSKADLLSNGSHSMYIMIPRERVGLVAKMYQNGSEPIEKALESLRKAQSAKA